MGRYYWTVVWRPAEFDDFIVSHIDLEHEFIEDATAVLVACINAELSPNGALFDETSDSITISERTLAECNDRGWDLIAVFPGHIQAWR